MRIACLGAVCVLLACPPAAAQSAPSTPRQPQAGPPRDVDELNLADLLDSTVSIAAGQVQRLEEAPSIVSVVTDEDIRRLGARSLQEVLETIPGFEVLVDNVGRSRIVVRGIATTTGVSESVLVLHNGHRLNEQITGGATSVNLDIPLYNVKRIEIIRGPGSALYGSNAFLGVINIVTLGSRTLEGVDVSVGAGSYATQDYSVTGAHSAGALGVSGSLQFGETDGPRHLIAADAQTLADGALAPLGLRPISLAPGPAHTDRRAFDLGGQAIYKGLTVNARLHDERDGGFIGRVDALGTRNRLDNRQILLDASHTAPLGARARMALGVSFNQNEIRENLNPLPPGFSRPLPAEGIAVFPLGILIDFSNNSRRYGADGSVEYVFAPGTQLTVGAGFEREATFDVTTSGDFDAVTGAALPALQPLPFTIIPESSRKVFSLFAQQTLNASRAVSLTAGARYDRYSDFGNTLNPRAALVWRLPGAFHVKALYGRAFRAPSFYELFFNLPVVFQGNPELGPATIDTAEVALGYRRRNLRVSTNYFLNRIHDFIASTRALTPAGILGVATFVNTPGLDVHGVEVEARQTFGLDHSFFFNYTFQHPTEQSGPRRPDVPAHLANVGATAALGRYVSASPTVLLRGSRPRQSNDPRPAVDSYGVMNLNVRFRNLWETLELSIKVNNVFDQRYVDPAPFGGVPGDYPAAGRNVMLRADYKF